MEDILSRARARGAQAEVFEITSQETSIEFENNRLKRAETVERAGLAVRVIAQGRIGFATSSLPADQSSLLDQALATAAYGKEAGFAFPAPPSRRQSRFLTAPSPGSRPKNWWLTAKI